MDEAAQEHVRQFKEQSIIANIDDRRTKDLWVARIELALEKFQLLHFYGIHFGFGRGAFGDRNVLSHRSDLSHVRAIATRVIASGQRAMHNEIGITPDRTREMGVVIFGETVVAERLRRVTGALQTF